MSCLDEGAGPHYGSAQFSVEPVFAVRAAKIIAVAKARFVIMRVPSGDVALDTVLAIASGQDSVDLGLRVVLLSTTETFNLTIALIGPAGDTVFRGGPIVVTAQSGGGTGPTPVPVPIVYSGTGSNAVSVKFAVHDTAMFAEDTVQLTAQAFDKAGVVIPNTPIVFTSLDTSKLTVPSALSAKVVGRPARGKANVQALLLTGLADTAHVAVQPVPSAIAVATGNAQTAPILTALPLPIAARVTAADGLGVGGVYVHFAPGNSFGVVFPDSAKTDSTGLAQTGWSVGTKAGPETAVGTTARLSGATANFTATVLAGPVDSMAVSAGSGGAGVVGSAVTVPPAVVVKDHFSNPIAGATVQFLISAGGGAVTGASPTTNASGVAAVTSWTMGTTVGTNTLRARVAKGATDSLVILFNTVAAAGPVTSLARIAGDAQTGSVATQLPDTLVVEARDQFGNVVPKVPVSWTPAASSGIIAAVKDSTSTVGQAGALWTLGSVAGAQSGKGFALSAGAAGPVHVGDTLAVVFGATGTPNPAAAITLATHAGNLASIGDTARFVATARDGFGNPVVPQPTISWTSTANGIATVSATGLATAVSNGVAKIIAGTGGFADTAIVTVAQVPVSLTVTPVLDTLKSLTDTVRFAASVRDARGSAIAGASVTWVSRVPGVATVNGVGLATAVSNGTSRIVATAGAAADSGVLVVNQAAIGMALGSGQSQTDTIGAPLAQPITVKVSDALGAGVPGVVVNFAVTSGGGSVSAPTATTNASGNASVTRTLGGTPGSAAASATVAGLTGSPVTFNSTILPGNAAALAFSVQPPASTSTGVAMTPAIQVAIKDRNGNAVATSTANVTMAIHTGTGTGGATLSGTLTKAAVAGVATFSDLSINLAGVNYQFDATGTGLTTATSSAFTIALSTFPTGDHWTAATGNWSLASNWSRGVVPTTNDTAFIDAGGTFTVTIDAAAHVRFLVVGNGVDAPTVAMPSATLQVDSSGSFAVGSTLNLSGGTLAGIAPVTIGGTFLWSSGTMQDSGLTRINAGATASFNGIVGKGLTNRVLDNAGSVTYAGSGVISANGSIHKVSIINEAGATWDFQGPTIAVVGGTAEFLNAGTAKKSGAGTLTMGIAYTNTGTTLIQAGTLELTGNPNRLAGGMTFSAGTDLLLSANSDTLFHGFSVSGGRVRVTGATVVTTMVTPDTATFKVLDFQSGVVGGVGILQMTDTLLWTGGTMSGLGTTFIPSGARALVSGANAKFINDRKLENAGTFNFGGSNVLQVNGTGQTQKILNDASGAFDFQVTNVGGSLTLSGGTALFLNKGSVFKSGSSTRATVQVAYVDSGFTSIQVDTLEFTGSPGRYTGQTIFGATSGHQGQLMFTSGADSILKSALFTGPGHVIINGATVAIGLVAADTVNIPGVALISGNLSGSGVVGIDSLFWTGGTMNGLGGTFLKTGSVTTVSGANAKFITSRKLENGGNFAFGGTNVIQSNGSTQAVNIINRSGAVMDIQNATVGASTFTSSGGTVQFLNKGTFRKSSSSARTLMQIAYADSGVTDIQIDTLEFQGNPNRFTGNISFGSGSPGHPGQLNLTTNNDTITSSATFSDPAKVGRININGATVTIGSLAADTVNIRSLLLASGTLQGPSTLAITDTLAWTGGTMGTNSGSTFLRSTAVTLVTGANAKFITGRKLENAGTFNFGGTNVIQSNGSTQTVNIINGSGALVDIQNATQGSSTFTSSGGTVQFLNKGTFRKSSASTHNLMQIAYADSGVTDVKVDTLEFQGNPNRFTGNVIFGNGTASHPGQLYFATSNDTITTSASFTDASKVGRININGATVTLGTLATDTVNIRSLLLASGTLQGPSIMAISDTLAWTGGTMGTNTGTTFLRPTAVTLVTGANAKFLTGRQLENAGTFNFGGTNVIQSNGSTQTVNIINRSGAVVDLQNTVAGSTTFSVSGGTVQFTNRGTFRKSSSSSRNVMQVAYADSGTTDIQLDTLEFSGGSNRFAGTVSTGSTAGHPGAIYFTANNDTLYRSLSITGPGHMVMNAATVLAGVGATDTAFIPILDMQGGTLSGNGVAAIVNGLNWLGGTMAGTGSTYLGASSVDSTYGANAKFINNRKFDNFGAFNLAGSNVLQVNGSGQAVVMRNESGATFSLSGTAATATITVSGGQATFRNIGTFQKMSTYTAVQTPVVQIAYVDSGTTSIAQDTLAFSGSSVSFAGNVVYGTPAGGHSLPVLRIDNGSDTLYKAVSFPDPTVNPGTFQVNGGNIAIGKPTDDTVKVPRIFQNTGTIQGPSVLLITDSLLWTGGTMTGIGKTRIDPRARAALSPVSTDDLNTRQFANGGTLVMTGANSLRPAGSNVTITNESGATWDFQSSADIIINSGSGHTFVNNGLLKRSAGTGASIIQPTFTNGSAGVIDVVTDTLSLSAGSNVLGGTIEGAGMLLTGASPSFTGTIDPGASGSGSIGILKIGPNFTPGASTTLQFDIGGGLGGTAGVDYDQLVDSTGALNSLANFTIKVNPIGAPDFSALGGNSNVIIRCVTSCSQGGPAPTLDASALPSVIGDVWTLTYSGGNVLLTLFVTSPEPEPTPGQLAALSRTPDAPTPLASAVRSFLSGKTQAERDRVYSDALGLNPVQGRR